MFIGLLMVLLFSSSLVFSEIKIENPSLAIVVENQDGRQRLSGVELTIEDNYDMLEYREKKRLMTDENGKATFGVSELDKFTIFKEGDICETFESDNPEKTYNDHALFKVKVTAHAPSTLPVAHEIEIQVNENVEYTIHIKK